MKRFVLFLLTIIPSVTLYANTYYSHGSLNPGALSSWGTTMVAGAPPPSFTNDGDIFIIQNGHAMTTIATWTFGNINSKLQIQNGGTLEGKNLIQFTGTFQIDNGGLYIHDNASLVSQTTGTSIFGGTESFDISSTVEIRNWVNSSLRPPAVTAGYGNLTINLLISLGNWNWSLTTGDIVTINGNFSVVSMFGNTLRLSGVGDPVLINVGGNFSISGSSSVNLKTNGAGTTTGNTTMQVDGNIIMSGTAQLNLGAEPTSGGVVGNYELRYKGSFTAVAANVITGATTNYLVANRTGTQSLTCPATMNCNFRVAAGSVVNLLSGLSVGSNKVVAIQGTFNQGINTMTTNGVVETAGGVFNSGGAITTVGCTACTGDGTYDAVNATWCTGAGTKGVVNFTGNMISINNNVTTSFLSAGSLYVNSPGEVYLVNADASTLNPASSNSTIYSVKPSSIFSLDGTSSAGGLKSSYLGQAGLLRIGSPDGITIAGNPLGNITSDLRYYGFVGNNDFEYFGTATQVTGNGLPTNIFGTLKINNTAGMGTTGVTLTQSTTVTGVLDLTQGKITTSLASLLSMEDNSSAISYSDMSFVNGPMTKRGDDDFEYPVGEGNALHLIRIDNVFGGNQNISDSIIVQYFKANPQVAFPGTYAPGINHISALEYWMVNKVAGHPALTKQVTLQATTYTDATDLNYLVVTHNPNPPGTTWLNDGQAFSSGVSTGPVMSNNTIIKTAPFTFGSSVGWANPLPINLISFDAVKMSSTKSSVNWELAVCCSPEAKFEIQRAGTNKSFTTIDIVGGSATNRFYVYTDNDMKSGINYYRLKTIDEKGTVSYSRIVAIMNGVNGVLFTSLTPSIVTGNTTLTIASSYPGKMDLIITDMQGRIVQKRNYAIVAGNTSIQLSVDLLTAGAYQLTGIIKEGKTNSIRFIKQ